MASPEVKVDVHDLIKHVAELTTKVDKIYAWINNGQVWPTEGESK